VRCGSFQCVQSFVQAIAVFQNEAIGIFRPKVIGIQSDRFLGHCEGLLAISVRVEREGQERKIARVGRRQRHSLTDDLYFIFFVFSASW
jgi:hypothetical protein